MPYSVACGCGKVHEVSSGSAGTKMACSCGRTVEVPSLSVLRREAGEFSASPELIIESMLANQELPEDSLCAVCHVETDHICYFNVICEQVEAEKKGLGVFGYVAALLVGMLSHAVLFEFMSAGKNPQTRGRNVRYRLPLRLCPVCATDKGSALALLSHVPVYAHLFKKYPHARIWASLRK